MDAFDRGPFNRVMKGMMESALGTQAAVVGFANSPPPNLRAVLKKGSDKLGNKTPSANARVRRTRRDPKKA